MFPFGGIGGGAGGYGGYGGFGDWVWDNLDDDEGEFLGVAYGDLDERDAGYDGDWEDNHRRAGGPRGQGDSRSSQGPRDNERSGLFHDYYERPQGRSRINQRSGLTERVTRRDYSPYNPHRTDSPTYYSLDDQYYGLGQDRGRARYQNEDRGVRFSNQDYGYLPDDNMLMSGALPDDGGREGRVYRSEADLQRPSLDEFLQEAGQPAHGFGYVRDRAPGRGSRGSRRPAPMPSTGDDELNDYFDRISLGTSNFERERRPYGHTSEGRRHDGFSGVYLDDRERRPYSSTSRRYNFF